MKLIKGLITLVVIAAVAGVGIVLAAPKVPQAQLLKDKLHLAAIQPLADSTLASAAAFQTQLPKLGSVLGVKTEQLKNSKEASIPQKTLEYARYAYCQQVVKDYEGRMGINASASSILRPVESPKPSEHPKASESPRPSAHPASGVTNRK